MLKLKIWYTRYVSIKLNGIIKEIEEIERQVKVTSTIYGWQQERLLYLARKKGELEVKLGKKVISKEQT